MKNKKQRARIRNICILVALLVIVFFAFRMASSDEYEQTREDVLAKGLNYEDSDAVTYEDYLSLHEDAYPPESAGVTTLEAASYSESDMEGLDEKDGVVWTPEEGSITYSFDVKDAGFYNIRMKYYPDTSGTQTILRDLYLNGQLPFDDCEDLSIDRLWTDDNKDWLMNTSGNQASPTQIQLEGPGIADIQSNECDTIGSYMFYMNEGSNTLTLVSKQAALGLEEISLVPARAPLSYSDYFAYWQEASDKVDLRDISDGAIIVQAEDAALKSSSSLSPNNDRTSVATQPYDPTYIVYNTIGGDSWASAGQTITWKVDAPQAGLYRLGVRFKQYLNRGFYSARYLTVNGELPFREAAQIDFYYGPDWQISFLGGPDGDYFFYLNEGENTISMTATLGDLAGAVDLARVGVDNLNLLYRELTAVTGTSPDEYRDYQITTYVPELAQTLEKEYTRLNTVVEEFGESIDSANKTSSVVDMMNVMVKLIKKPDDVAKYLGDFNDALSALAEWLTSVNNLPLELDYLVVAGNGYKLPKAEGGFLANVGHTWRAFLGSFTNDFQVHSEGESKDKKTLTVWVAVDARAQYDIIQKMVNASFQDASYNVNVSMVSGDTVLPATVAGSGPDVVLHSSYSTPVNFAYRNAALDLTQFEDFEEVYTRFPEDTRGFLEYEGGVYGMPDQLTFPVTIYRTDVLESLGLEVPETWDDLISIIPYLEADNMSVYLGSNEYTTLGGGTSSTTVPVNGIFLSMLYQNGFELYNDDFTATELSKVDLMEVFKYWTEFYTKQGLNYSVNLPTRFRTGEIPVAVVDYNTYVNQLNVSAPEISGKWSIARMPGTRREDGTVDHTAASMISTCFIVSTSVEKDGMKDAAWDFLKWWTDAPTQENYSTELKAENGEASEFPVANVEAISGGGLNEDFKQVVLSLLPDLRSEPQVPGGYITGRVVRNAFTTVVTDNVDPVDTLYIQLDEINSEITSKRTEFGLNTAE